MKTMNYFVLLCLLAFCFSCSEPELDIDEPSATHLKFRFEQQPEYLNGLELYRHAGITTQLNIKQEISELNEVLLGRQRSALPKLKAAQETQSNLIGYMNGLTMIKVPKGRFPPRPPKGCWEDPNAGCIPQSPLDISGFSGIEVTDGLDTADVVIRDKKNNIVGRGGSVTQLRDGTKVIPLDTNNFEGDGTMYITPKSMMGKNDVTMEVSVTIH